MYAVALGASTGGPQVVEDILLALNNETQLTLFIAQHMPDFFIKRFSERMERTHKKKCYVISQGLVIDQNSVYFASANQSFSLKKNEESILCETSNFPDFYKGSRPSIDLTFKALSDYYKNNFIGVILSGMGRDGTEGAKYAKTEHKSIILAQEPSDCIIDSMPKSAIQENTVDFVLGSKELANKIKAISNG